MTAKGLEQRVTSSLQGEGVFLRPPREEETLREKQKKEKENFLDPEKTKNLTEALNNLFQAFNLELRFSIHEGTREVIARIVNRETGEVIREIPPEKFLDMIAKLRELAGLFIDELV